MKDVFEFDKDAETGGVINKLVGRIHLWDGRDVRVTFGPQGISIAVWQTSIGRSVVVLDDGPLGQTLGSLLKEGCGRTDSDEKRKEHFRAESVPNEDPD